MPAFIVLIMCLASVQVFAFDTTAKHALLMDDQTQTLLFAKDAEQPMPPSSMSKLMTLYVLFERIKQGSLKLDDTFNVSEKAWRMGGSKMFVRVDTKVKIEDLIRGIIIQSGNDACIVVAEGVAGSEESFAIQMNEAAKKLGLTQSHFTNSTGWPDDNHRMSAHDLVIVSQRLITDFPDLYPYFAEKSFTYSDITQPNRNRLLDRDIGVDGLKTGHTEVAGYGITVSAKEADSGRRVTLAINGLQSDDERVSEAERLVRHGLRDFEVRELLQAEQSIAHVPVWMGQADHVQVGPAQPLRTAIPLATGDLRFQIVAEGPAAAPVQQGQKIATLQVYRADQLVQETDLVALATVETAGFFRRIGLNLSYMLGS